MNMRPTASLIVGAVLALALGVNLAVATRLGLGRPMASDAHYYLALAQSLAAGQGYVLRDGFWPNAPTLSRSPGWPALIAGALKVCPRGDPDTVMRLLGLGLNALAAALVAALTWRLFRRRAAAAAAGVAYTFHPAAVYYAYEGASEILFGVLLLAGALVVLGGRRGWRWAGGGLVLGLACLVRPNAVVAPFFAAVPAALVLWRTHRREWVRAAAVALAVATLFLAPSLAWAARNQRVCGHFPVLSTLRGQTFYGGNNALVADTLAVWGYWVFPNSIPGEPPMAELAARMTEYEVDVYYFRQGQRYLAAHPSAWPRLLLGKLVRAWVPIPWKPTAGSLAVSAFRWLLYVAAAWGLVRLWRATDPRFQWVFWGLLGSTLFTVLAFWGCSRFVFPMEMLLLPFAAGIVRRGEDPPLRRSGGTEERGARQGRVVPALRAGTS
jgi:4-amino-4-deoxy-L-arabinose transferase-like glycosyltransferase